MSIRPYEPRDEAEWLQCRLLSFFDTDYYDDVKIAKTPLPSGSIQLVVEQEGRIVGLIDVELDGELGGDLRGDRATIDSIAVPPDARRHGVGRALLERAIGLLPARVRQLDAWTRESPAANAWYRHSGFVEEQVYLHVYRGEGDPEFAGPAGLSSPVLAFMHAPLALEVELRATYARVYRCRRYVQSVRV